MSEARVDGLRIDYDEVGSGEPALLLLPGWCVSREVFDGMVEHCASFRRVVELDWRGHGHSDRPEGDFGAAELVEDALAVVEASGARSVVPVAVSHAGWVAVELRRRLGGRVPKLVLLDWIVLDPPPPFLAALEALQDPARWEQAREGLFEMWMHGVEGTGLPHLIRREMGSYGAEMWARAAREISAAYAAEGSPLAALASLEPKLPTLHLYAQPDDPGYLAAQEAFAAEHPWFSVRRLEARSHFPTFEVPEEMASAIEVFVAGADR